MMNFSGPGKRRQINLGGSNTSGVSRSNALQRAKEDRERREQTRREAEAALVIQSFFRSRRMILATTSAMEEEWDEKFLHNPVSLQTTELADEMVRMFTFITRVRHTSSMARLDRVHQLVAGPTPISKDVLSTFESVVERWLLCNPDLFPKAVDLLMLIPEMVSPTAFGVICENRTKLANDGWEAMRVFSTYLPEQVALSVLVIPEVFDHIAMRDLPLSVAVSGGKNSQAIMELVGTDQANLVTNITTLINNNRELEPGAVDVLALAVMNLDFDTRTYFDDEDEDEDEEDLSPSQLQIQQSLTELYSSEFVTALFGLLATSPDSTSSVAVLFSKLVQIRASRECYMIMVRAIQSSKINQFWTAFKDSAVFSILADHLPTSGIEHSVLANDYSALAQLSTILDLYSLYLMIVEDNDFWSEYNTQGLPFSEIKLLCTVLKRFIYINFWYKPGVNKRIRYLSLAVLRQIYNRDCRSNVLGKEFWPMEINIKDVDTTVITDPRAQMLIHAPYLVSFDARVDLFQRTSHHQTLEEEDVWSQIMPSRRGSEPRVIERGNEFNDGFEKFGSGNMPRRLRVQFHNEFGTEDGIDGGGLTKEFLNSVAMQGFDPQQGLFVESHNYSLFPNPDIAPDDEQSLARVGFLGKIIGKSLLEGILLNVEFAPFFLQKVQGKGFRNTFDDLADQDQSVYNSLLKVARYDGNFSELGLTFVYGNTPVVPGGEDIPLTRENRLEYVQAVADLKLNKQLAKQSQAFFAGMDQLVPAKYLSIFNAYELQTLISGDKKPIDVDDLKRNTAYAGWNHEHVTVKLFWQVVGEMSNQELSLLLQFVTSAPKPPLGGFKALNPRFGIRMSRDGNLPTASTCVNLLKLPPIQEKTELRKKLLLSITSGAGFDLS